MRVRLIIASRLHAEIEREHQWWASMSLQPCGFIAAWLRGGRRTCGRAGTPVATYEVVSVDAASLCPERSHSAANRQQG
jgi:hypothetical protein